MHFINLEKKRVLCWQISSTSVWVEIAVQLCNESHNKPEPPHALFCCGVSGDYPGLWLVQYCTVQNLPEIKKGGGGADLTSEKKTKQIVVPLWGWQRRFQPIKLLLDFPSNFLKGQTGNDGPPRLAWPWNTAHWRCSWVTQMTQTLSWMHHKVSSGSLQWVC